MSWQKLLFVLVTTSCFTLAPNVITLAATSVSDDRTLQNFRRQIGQTDVLLLDGAVIVERLPGCRITTNSAQLLRVGPNIYGQHISKGGINQSNSPLSIATLIPLFEYRGSRDPAGEITSIMVNGRKVDGVLFVEPQNSLAIQAAYGSFNRNQLLQTQVEGRTPNLYVWIGKISPGESFLLEYDLKPRGPVKVN